MSFRLKVLLVVLAVIICVGGPLAYVIFSGHVYLFKEDLTYTAEKDNNDDEYVVKFYKGDEDNEENYIANANIEVEKRFNDRNWIRVSVWHSEDTHLDAMSLVFHTQQIQPAITLKAPNGSWAFIEFHHAAEAKDVIFDIPRLGFLGVGTVVYEFYVGPYPLPPDQIILDVNLKLHNTEDVVKITKQEAKGSVEIELPKDGI